MLHGRLLMTKWEAPVGIVGAGPIGLATALRLASFGIASVVLEAEPRLPEQGSKACVIQGDVVEILDKVGVGETVAAEGLPWHIGRTYVRGRQLFDTTYRRTGGFSPWTNLSQYRVQQIMLERLATQPRAEVRWGHRVSGVAQDGTGVTVRVDAPDGPRELRCQYLVAADGIHSEVRRLLDVPWTGYRHGDRFLIADIRAALTLPHMRHFHYDPPVNPGRQLVMHPQPDDVWRIDWQLPTEADIDAERHNGELDRRIRRVIGEIPYEIKWLSTYRFNQRVVERMRVDRVLFAGDAAHALPPYGARGMNSGIQDADNLAWKLAIVLSGGAPESLLDTYHVERHAAARENLRVTENTIKFMVPPSPARRLARNVLLKLAPLIRPLRRRVDSGQMAEPYIYTDSPIVASDPASPLVGCFAPDGEIRVDGRPSRLRRLLGAEFVVLYFGADPRQALRFARRALAERGPVPMRLYLVLPDGVEIAGLPEGAGIVHGGPRLRETYDAEQPCWYLIRPDSHIAASHFATSHFATSHDDASHDAQLGPSVGDALRRAVGAAVRPSPEQRVRP